MISFFVDRQRGGASDVPADAGHGPEAGKPRSYALEPLANLHRKRGTRSRPTLAPWLSDDLSICLCQSISLIFFRSANNALENDFVTRAAGEKGGTFPSSFLPAWPFSRNTKNTFYASWVRYIWCNIRTFTTFCLTQDTHTQTLSLIYSIYLHLYYILYIQTTL